MGVGRATAPVAVDVDEPGREGGRTQVRGHPLVPTRRARPDGRSLTETIAGVRASHPDAFVMADCGSLPDALAAAEAGADLVGTTLAGYSGERPPTDGPDLELLAEVVAALPEVPVVAEGRIHSPADAAAARTAGAHCVVVGTAITHPTTLTRWFAAALPT